MSATFSGHPDAITAIQRLYGIDLNTMLGRERTARVALARQVAMYRAHRETRQTLSEIGAAFGRDHSNVSYAVRQIRNRMDTDARFRAEIQRHQLSQQQIG